jgi:hypothetical protein
LHRDLEALCEEPLCDLQKYMNTREAGTDKIFYGRYNRTDPKDLDKSLSRELNALEVLLKNAKVDVVNYSKRFLFLKPKGSLSSSKQILQDSPLVDIYGLTDVAVSGHGGRIFASIDKKPISYELDIYGRKGLRTDFEREVYSYLLDFVTNRMTKPELFTKLKSRFAELAQNKISKVDFIFYTNTELEPWEYSWPAQNHERVKAFNALGARKGDKLVFGYGIDKFGDKRRFKAEDFFRDDVKIDIEAYQDKFFGNAIETGRNLSQGTISDLVYSICPAKKDYERLELARFLEGTGDLKRWDVYEKSKQEKLF